MNSRTYMLARTDELVDDHLEQVAFNYGTMFEVVVRFLMEEGIIKECVTYAWQETRTFTGERRGQ